MVGVNRGYRHSLFFLFMGLTNKFKGGIMKVESHAARCALGFSSIFELAPPMFNNAKEKPSFYCPQCKVDTKGGLV